MNKHSIINQKNLAVILTICLVISLILSGCNVNIQGDERTPSSGSQESTASTSESPESTEPQASEDTTNPPGGFGPSKPEEPSEPTTNQESTAPTDPETSDTTEPEASEPDPSVPAQSESITYLDYYEMSADEQQAFINSFESLDAFFAWLSAAQQEYEEGRTPIDGTTPLTP